MSNPNDTPDEPDDELFPHEVDRLAIDDEPVEDGGVDTRPTDPRMTGAPQNEETLADRPNDAPAEDRSGMDAMTAVPGMIADGLTDNETFAIVGMTLLSYTLAWGVLSLMAEHGFHHAPIGLWAILAVLVGVPLALLFGTDSAHRIMETVTGSDNTRAGEHGDERR